eukprot:83465_1
MSALTFIVTFIYQSVITKSFININYNENETHYKFIGFAYNLNIGIMVNAYLVACNWYWKCVQIEYIIITITRRNNECFIYRKKLGIFEIEKVKSEEIGDVTTFFRTNSKINQ